MDSSIILILSIVIIFLIYNSSNKIYYQLQPQPQEIYRYPTFHGGHRGHGGRGHGGRGHGGHSRHHNKLIGGNPATWGPPL